MDKNLMDMSIFNELAEQITIHLKSYHALTKPKGWSEHKVHIDYDLWIVQSGTIYISINGITHAANPGDVIFFYPQLPYMAASPDDECRFIYIHFDFEIGGQQRILSDFPLSGIIPQELIGEEALLFSKNYMQLENISNIPGMQLSLKASLMLVVAKIIEIYGNGKYAGTFLNGFSSRKSEKSLDALRPVFRYINNHLHTPIKMSELAELVGISEKYFISYFKKALGITPGQYINQVKMNRARDYLYEKKHTIQQIACYLGYPDPFTFSKAFKKHYNSPPSKFL
ncbi:AraC family transcriptional regulator [Paenibacillus puerhi]|uniref:AraC family transcriptional regulator n=1 Tax=Paenibacillus puerhi TaxID=2692622 RepID=UPI001F42FB1E|nr:AraC family transcriptional regulator [Paenibacillus puerhi]